MEPLAPRILLVAGSTAEPERCSRLKADLSAAGLWLQHCGSLGEAGELCGSVYFDCAVVDSRFIGSPQLPEAERFEALPRLILTDADTPLAESAAGLSSLRWEDASVDRLVREVRRLVERRRLEATSGGAASSTRGAGGRAEAATAELGKALALLRRRFIQVDSVFEGLRSLSSLEPDEAHVEMAMFVQRHEEVVADVWASVRDCERALGRLSPRLKVGQEAFEEAEEEEATWIGPSNGGTPSPQSQDPRGTPVPVPVRRRVLVVDDDPSALRAFRRVLRGQCDVLTARDGGEALSLIMGQAVDVVCCDLSMPKVDGASFFRELSELKPELTSRVIFCTGGTPPEETGRFLATLSNRVLRKPVDARDLLLAIERVCTARPSSGSF